MGGNLGVTGSDTDLLIRNGFTWRLGWVGSVSAGGTVTHGIVVGSLGAIIMDRVFSISGTDMTFDLFRDTSWSGGSAWARANRNDRYWGDSAREALSSSATTVTASPSSANQMGGVRLFGTQNNIVSFVGESAQIVLAPLGAYVIRVTNNGPSAANAEILMTVAQDRVSSGLMNWDV